MIPIFLRAVVVSATLTASWALLVGVGRVTLSLLQGRRLDRTGGRQ